MADTEGKKLTELRVIDLKTELERRGLDKTGNKAALLERLSKAITDEGENPEEFLIVPCVGVNKISPRKNSATGAANQDEPMDTQDNSKDESNDNQENTETKPKEETTPSASNDETNSIQKREPQIILQDAMKKPTKTQDTKSDGNEKTSDENSEEEKEPEKKSETETSESTESSPSAAAAALPAPPPPAPPAPTIAPVTPAPPVVLPAASASTETNGIDNEDSINLTIGEDEENLLAEETETHVRQKDGGAKKRNEDNKKGDSKGSGRADGCSSGNKDGVSSNSNAGIKSKQDGGDGGKSGDSTNKGQKRDDKDKKTTQSSPANASSRNLWVSGLSSTTRATDLKQIFSKYGKVIGAKVVTNARTPGARCYGYVTMSTSEDAAKCIQHLHRTELHGRVISVEKAKGDSQQSHMRKRESNNGKPEKKEDKDKLKDAHEPMDKKDKDPKKDIEEKSLESAKKIDGEKGEGVSDEKKIEASEKKEDATKDADTRSTKSTSKKPESERGKRDDKRIRNWENHRSHSRSRSRERRRRDDVLTFAKIREERERQRLRQREWMLREEERRRREDVERQREIERRQRDEAARLEREREKLRREREKIEQEKAELLRLERERQKLEREKLERERLELKRQQMRLEESRRAPPPPSIKRTSSDRRDPRDLYVEPDRKRLTTEHSRRHSPPDRVADRRPEILDRVSDRRMDPSPPTRYDSTRSTQDLALKKDFKRGAEFTSRSSRPDAFPEVSRGREVIVRRETIPAPSSSIDSRQVKERYERPTTATYGREREVRRSDPESHRSTRDSHTRYSDSSKPPGSSAPRDSRYGDSNRAPSGWHSGGPPSTKSFNSVPSGGPRDPRNEPGWSSRSSDNVNRWSNSSSMGSALRHPGPGIYQGGPIQSIGGLAAPGTAPSYDRFDPYKSSMPSLRKY